jgi:hypothetical protein
MIRLVLPLFSTCLHLLPFRTIFPIVPSKPPLPTDRALEFGPGSRRNYLQATAIQDSLYRQIQNRKTSPQLKVACVKLWLETEERRRSLNGHSKARKTRKLAALAAAATAAGVVVPGFELGASATSSSKT